MNPIGWCEKVLRRLSMFIWVCALRRFIGSYPRRSRVGVLLRDTSAWIDHILDGREWREVER